MLIVIPTRGREGPIKILQQLECIRKYVALVCPKEEKDNYLGWNVIETDSDLRKGLPGKLHFVTKYLGEPFFKFDDDLRIYYRPSVTQQKVADDKEIRSMYDWMVERLSEPTTGAVNLMGKFGCNNLPMDRDKPYGSVRHAYGVRPDVMEEVGFSFYKAPMFCEDLDLCLSLLKNGYPVWTSCRWLADELTMAKARLVGGCQRIRTPENVIKAFSILQSRHPEYVRLSKQTSKKMMDHGFIKKVTCSWKKAYLDGQDKKGSSNASYI